MKSKEVLIRLLLFSALGVGLFPCAGQVRLNIHSTPSKLELVLPAKVIDPQLGLVLPEYTVERSFDLEHWEPAGGKVRAIDGRSGPFLNLAVDQSGSKGFFRVLASTGAASTQQTGRGGPEVFGYGAHFSQELTRLGALPVNAFASNSPQPDYLGRISWDLTTAQFWTNFNTDPAPINAQNLRLHIPDFRLTAEDAAIFTNTGFIVRERLGSVDFNDSFYTLFTADLPLFVSADAVLHAWFRTYSAMMEELEELQMSSLLESTLTKMASQLPQAWQDYGSGPLRDSILDADFFLAVGRSLWTGQQVTNCVPVADQYSRVTTALNAINGLQLRYIKPFGTDRLVDFSQFAVRGHYNNSDRLRRYFRTMMWCSKIDLRLVTFAPSKEDDIRQLGTSIILNYLLTKSQSFDAWSALERTTGVFVGPSDSMNFAQVENLLTAAGITSPADIPDRTALTNLQTQLLTGELGAQTIHGDAFVSPLGRDQLKLPRTFSFCGQKFTIDSWAFNQVTYDRLLWPPIGGEKVNRRKPSCLDIAYSVLANDQVVPELTARMTNQHGVPWRDGLPYQANLAAVRNVIDSQSAASWTNNLYYAWLSAVRALSAPTTDSRFPEAMRTRAWAMKTLNSQLASWTELRHETVLYAKQSNTDMAACSYPDGFVEPRPEFWQKMSDLASVAARAIGELSISGTVTQPSRTAVPYNQTFELGTVQAAQIRCLTNFAAQMITLRNISEKELAQQALLPEETDFLKNTIETVWAYITGLRQYSGWYPKLMYQNSMKVWVYWDQPNQWDALVADVHTDLPDIVSGDPGAVIHEGVGNVHMLMIAVDNGTNRAIYAGPVLSHYEFEKPSGVRLTDNDWKASFRTGTQPASPEWTRSYLIPGGLSVSGY